MAEDFKSASTDGVDGGGAAKRHENSEHDEYLMRGYAEAVYLN
jgi:hypothetical protein